MRFASTVRNASLSALLMAAACTSPTTISPQFTQAEVDAESKFQASAKDPFPPIVEPVHATKAMQERLTRVANRLTPQATKLCQEMGGQVCSFNLALKGEKGVNAYADGSTVYVTAPMMVFAQNDTHLALVVAHELAHNIMQHPQSMTGNVSAGALLGTVLDIAAASQGANTQGGFGKVGANVATMRYSPSFEQEADYIALYILARAGYNIDEAPGFWRNFSQYDPQGIYARGTHPSNPARFVAMSKTIEEIKTKKRLKQPLLPNMIPNN